MTVQIEFEKSFIETHEKFFGKEWSDKYNHPWSWITEIEIEKHEGQPVFTFLILVDRFGGRHRFDIFDIDKLVFSEGGDADATHADK